MSPVAFEAVEVLLLDADGNLFPSEEPAFDASTEVTNRLLASVGSAERWEPAALQRATLGKNFRTTAQELVDSVGGQLTDQALEEWIAEEREAVSAHLGAVLQPDPAVREPIERLARRYRLAVVSSSALLRLDACFRATGLEDLLPAERRYSAEDSMDTPMSKPNPAIYRHAGTALGVSGDRALAVEDSVSGARSAIAAGFPTVGNVQFVAEEDRADRTAQLRAEGVEAVVQSWADLEALLH